MRSLTAPSTRFSRPMAGWLGAGLVLASTVGLATLAQTSASAVIRGQVTVNPSTGTDATLFGGTATTECPADTQGSLFTVEGPNLEPFAAFLGNGSATGDGAQSFSQAAIANLRTNNAGSFATTSVYRIVFSCINAAGAATDTYEANLNYTAGGAGAYTITPAVVVSPSPATPVSPSPATPVSPSTSPGPGTGVGSGNAGTGGTGTGTGGTGSGTTGTGAGSRTGSTSGSLPRTGAATGALVALSLTLITGGAAMIVLGRRKDWFSFGTHQA